MTSSTTPAAGGDILVVDSPYEIANWRPLVSWVLFIPQAIILCALRAVAGVVFFIYWIALLVTGQLHPGMFGLLAMYERYSQRVTGFLFGNTGQYAPFDFTIGGGRQRRVPADQSRVPIDTTYPRFGL